MRHGILSHAGLVMVGVVTLAGLGGCKFIESVWNTVVVDPLKALSSKEPETEVLANADASAAGTSGSNVSADDAEAVHPDVPSVIEEPASDTQRYEAPNGRRLKVLRIETFENRLIARDLRDGTGDVCTEHSAIIVRYHGTLEDGTIIDSTRNGAPRGPWPVAQLMPGWRQGLIGMRVGGVRRLTIPPELGYGDQAVPDSASGEELIPVGATLIYVIELIEIR